MRELSSPFTFFYKHIFLFLWIAGFGIGTSDILLAGPQDPKWIQYMGVWVIIAVFIFFSTGDIKKVWMDENNIYVSNFSKTETIPLSNITQVNGSLFLSPKLVWFIVDPPSGFGEKITFIPKFRKTAGFSKHPLVEDLSKQLNIKTL